jgi:hypothetical protein
MTTASLSHEAQEVAYMTEQTIGKDLLSALLDEIRNMPNVWQKLGQEDQQDIIDRLSSRVDDNCRTAVNLIASQGRIVVTGALEQITIKDGVKAVVKFGQYDPNMHELYDAQGKAVLVVVVDHKEHTGGMGEIKADPDQNPLDLHDGDGIFATVSETVDDELQPPSALDKTKH